MIGLFEADDGRPLFQQIADWIEEGIMSGAFKDEQQIPSTTEISGAYGINPATVLKGVNILVERRVIYKKRGLGMFVRSGAAELVKKTRREQFYAKFIPSLIKEAKNLGVSGEELCLMIQRGYEV